MIAIERKSSGLLSCWMRISGGAITVVGYLNVLALTEGCLGGVLFIGNLDVLSSHLSTLGVYMYIKPPYDSTPYSHMKISPIDCPTITPAGTLPSPR